MKNLLFLQEKRESSEHKRFGADAVSKDFVFFLRLKVERVW